jgi:hypothetical protein
VDDLPRYPDEEPDEPYEVIPPDSRDYSDRRLIGVAQWTALAAGFATLAASIVTSAAVASSHDWGATSIHQRSLPGLVRGAGGGVVIGGIVVGLLLAVLFYTVARGFASRPRGGAIFFFIVAALLAAAAVVLLAAPHLVVGDAGSVGVRPASSALADARAAGQLLALGAALAACAAGLAAAAGWRTRREAPR